MPPERSDLDAGPEGLRSIRTRKDECLDHSWAERYSSGRTATSCVMAEVPLETLANGYLQAWERLRPTVVGPDQADAIFIPLFETLNWLDALLQRPEIRLMPYELHLALRFVRGAVHHAWSEVMEFRTDIVQQLPVGAAGKPGHTTPVLLADWCWLPTAELEGTGHPNGEAAYEALLAGRQVRGALSDFAGIAHQLATVP
jgi:hypothetical protein